MLRYIGGSYESSDDIIKHNEIDISNSLIYINQLKPKKFIQTMSQYDISNNLYSTQHNFSKNELDENGYPLYVESDIQTGFIVQDILSVNELKFFVIDSGIDNCGNRIPYLLNYNNFM